MNYVSPSVYEYIQDAATYDIAIETLTDIYVKPVNKVYARYRLATRRQGEGESLDAFIQDLHRLSKECSFEAVTAEVHRQQHVRDAFISGIQSKAIRQKLLENKDLTMDETFDQAGTLQTAHRHAESYNAVNQFSPCAATHPIETHDEVSHSDMENTVAATNNQSCWFCGGQRHVRRNLCPAWKHLCKLCGKRNHYEKVCNSARNQPQSAAIYPTLATASVTESVSLATTTPTEGKPTAFCNIKIKKHSTRALLDSGSLSWSFIDQQFANRLGLFVIPSTDAPVVSMANSSMTARVEGEVHIDIMLQHRKYQNVRLYVLGNLCADVILGQDFMKQHQSVVFNFGGEKPSLIVNTIGTVSTLTAMNIPAPRLFEHLTDDCRPIVVRSRKQTPSNAKFIHEELQKLLVDGIVRPSTSPWRAQVLVTKDDGTHKRRMVVDYKQTINRFTELDAYPLPDSEEMVRKISQYKWFSTFDLKSAYHQVPICEEERKYTAFEADGGLWEFCRVPFGVTNGVSKFQRTIDTLVQREGLDATFPFMDNVTVAGNSKEELLENEAKFLEICKKYNLTLNIPKTISAVESLPLLGYLVSHGEIKPDPERLLPLLNLAAPCDTDSQRRIVGMFAYYSRWIPKYSDKIRPLINNKTFPLPPEALQAFESLKDEIAAATLVTPLEGVPLEVETDASDHALAATLNQAGRPVAFFSRTLNKSERHHPAVEKEACAIVEAVLKWSHYLYGRHFTLITDQRSVSFMYDRKRAKSKIKNDKIMRWCMELSPYSYDIIYRPGPENKGADAFSRLVCSAILGSTDSVRRLHDALCHPGVTRFNHFLRTKNIPCSIEELRKLNASCPTCQKLKPQYHKSKGILIKATQPFERINLDFKGPLPSVTNNRYILTIVDEFSRFPFAFPTSDMSTPTVIKCLIQLFSFFGMPGFVHSDRGRSLISDELKSFLNSRGVATSRTSAYNPQGNGQVERYNGIIWKTVSLALESRGLSPSNWEHVLPDALHSIRSLLCTATNATPHDRLFNYQRRSSSGHSAPSWLSTGDRAYLRKHVRQSKYDPLLEEVEILDVNPQYAHVKLPSGAESTVSIRDLAPCGDSTSHHKFSDQHEHSVQQRPEQEFYEQHEHSQIQQHQQPASMPQQQQSHSPVTQGNQGAGGSAEALPEPVPENVVEVPDVQDVMPHENPVGLRRSTRSNIGKAPPRLIEGK